MAAVHRRERSVAIAIAALGALLAAVRPAYFSPENLVDLLLSNLGVMTTAIGTTLVVLTGAIDISVGSVFAICSVVAGVAAIHGAPVAVAALAACAAGTLLGLLNGVLVAWAGIPSIVVTLATMIALRDALRWTTQGEWISGLPDGFQWLGLTQRSYPFAATALVVLTAGAAAWLLRESLAGRAIYAVGSNAGAARLAGIPTRRVTLGVFVAGGLLTGLGALLNAVRFHQIPSNGGIGLEMKVVAAVVVGGAAVTGGRGTIAGTALGVVLLGAIGPALTFLGVSAYWERALQGAIILTAVGGDAIRAVRSARGAPAGAAAQV
jgi:ribose/xylose/arabinose/galactoside ABC-type transport system permease subunit